MNVKGKALRKMSFWLWMGGCGTILCSLRIGTRLLLRFTVCDEGGEIRGRWRRADAAASRRRHDGAAAPLQRRDAEKTEKNDVKIMQNGPKMSKNGPKNDPKRFENDSARAENVFFGGAISLRIYPPRRRG